MAKIICLECGRSFEHLGSHLRRMHDMSGDEYREAHALPRGLPLASDSYRETRRQILAQSIATGAMTRPDQADLVEAARAAGRPDKTPSDKEHHRKIVQALRPGDHSLLPDGARRANGRDAVREREYQRAYRAKRNGDPSAMDAWIAKYRG